MKRLLKIFAFLGGLGAAGWLLRNRVVAVTMNREPEAPRLAPEPASAADPKGGLTSIEGIGKADALLLEAAGAATAAELAEADAAALAAKTGIPEAHLSAWIEAAAALAASPIQPPDDSGAPVPAADGGAAGAD